MSNLGYSRESVERALNVHVASGAIRSWRHDNPVAPRPTEGDPRYSKAARESRIPARYVVELNDAQPLDLRTLREAWVFVAGLASASRSPKITFHKTGGRS